MPLPAKDIALWEELAAAYPTSTKEQRDKWAEELGYTSRDSFQNEMLHRNLSVAKPSPAELSLEGKPLEVEKEVTLIPVDLKEYKPKHGGRGGNPETQVLHLTDWHTGEETPTYNESIQEQRIENLFQGTLRIAELHRNMYPVNDLEIFITGDMEHGENPAQGGKVGTISCGAREQVNKAFKKTADLILSLKQNFSIVKVKCVKGNHGRYSKYAPSTSNWDLMLYDLLKTKLESYKIQVDISNQFYMITEIQGHRFFLVHLDQFRATYGIPWFSITKGLQSWYVTYGGFDYVVGGHFHRDDYLRISSRCKLLMGASIVTDDEFTQEVIKTSSIPCQWTFGVHKNKGITWTYPLTVDKSYFPKALKEKSNNVK